MATVTFRDETAMGKPLEEFTLPGLPARISASVGASPSVPPLEPEVGLLRLPRRVVDLHRT